MPLVVREEGSVPIPEELAQEFGIHKGSRIEWVRAEDGTLRLRPAAEGAGSRLYGILKPHVHENGEGVETFLRWRDEDAHLDGSG